MTGERVAGSGREGNPLMERDKVVLLEKTRVKSRSRHGLELEKNAEYENNLLLFFFFHCICLFQLCEFCPVYVR